MLVVEWKGKVDLLTVQELQVLS